MAAVIWQIVIPMLAVAGTVMLHQQAIRHVSRGVPVRGSGGATRKLVRGLLLLLVAHLLEIGLFALGYGALVLVTPDAALVGDIETGGVRDYLYFSASAYTSLGLGDIRPVGAARLLTGVEALTGLIMITWTAAFLFAETEQR